MNAFTGGDPEVTPGLRKAWADHDRWPSAAQYQAAPFANKEVWAFVDRAIQARHA